MASHKVVIIGGGPGGYEAAIRLSQYGVDCAVIEQQRLGGVCLNVGCIPTKALVKSAELFTEIKHAQDYGFPGATVALDYRQVFERKNKVVEQLVGGVEFLFRKRAIPVIPEQAVSVSREADAWLVRTDGGTEVRASYLILATGSVPKQLPGIAIDEQNILSSTGILALAELPQSLAVIGGGVIGCEFASVMNSFGVKTTIIEFLPRIVALEDEEISKRLSLGLKKAGIKIMTGVGVQSIAAVPEGQELRLSDGSKLVVEKVLLSVGRAPRNDLVWETGAPATEKGAVVIDDRMRASLPGVYAIGDLTAKLPLAHTASKQGLIAAEHINCEINQSEFHSPALDYAKIPRCTFTFPEVASVGLTEAEAIAKYNAIVVGRFPFSANGKALAMGNSYGFVKTVARLDDGSLVGMHIIGPAAAELIGQGALLLAQGATAAAVEDVVFAHPTLSEAIKESLEDLRHLSIHQL